MTKISNLFKVLWDSETGEVINSNIDYDIETSGYLHIQSEASSVWTINHKKNNTKFLYQIFSEDNEIIFADSMEIVDENSIVFNFNEAIKGSISIFFVTDVINPVLVTATPTPTPSVTPTISVTPSMTPTPSVTHTVTPTITVTPSITPTISVTPSNSLEIPPSPLPPVEPTPTPTITPSMSGI